MEINKIDENGLKQGVWGKWSSGRSLNQIRKDLAKEVFNVDSKTPTNIVIEGLGWRDGRWLQLIPLSPTPTKLIILFFNRSLNEGECITLSNEI